MNRSELDRRAFLALGGMVGIGTIVTACGGSSTKDLVAPASSAAPAASSAAASTEAASTAAADTGAASTEAASTAEASSAAASSAAPTATFDPKTEKGAVQVFDWAGYEIDEFWGEYKKGPYGKTNPLKFSFLQNDQQALAKVAGGYKTDVVHPCIAYTQDWVNAGLLQPWDTTYLADALAGINPKMLEAGMVDGKLYAIPWDWGFSAPVYRADRVQPKEMSWNIFLDDRYKGRMSLYNDGVSVIKIGGLINGVADPNKMTQDDIDAAKATMLKAKPLLRNFWGSETDTINDFVAGNIDVTYGWPGTWYQIKNKLKGVDVQYMQPKEGRLAWICSYVLTADTPRPGVAHEMMKVGLGPTAMSNLINLYGYGASNGSQAVLDLVKDKTLIKAFGLDNPNSMDAPAAWLEHFLPNRKDYVKAFDEIQAS